MGLLSEIAFNIIRDKASLFEDRIEAYQLISDWCLTENCSKNEQEELFGLIEMGVIRTEVDGAIK